MGILIICLITVSVFFIGFYRSSTNNAFVLELRNIKPLSELIDFLKQKEV